ncbi:hypothetical protein GCM10023093_15180 [Nemorincola caseinilytica]|uniref:T9SS C-terminal target domain-containing protein n=1 Tax=Nemorincola caseinilytica TaxID=2054315 RepID=A0ABP8NFH2_9BACT
MMNKILSGVLLTGMLAGTPVMAQWTVQTSTTTEQLNAVYATSATAAFAVGNNGVARKTTNGGTTWTTMSVDGTTEHITGVTFVSASMGYTCGAAQHVYETTNGGATWDNIGMGMTDLYDITAVSGSVWVCGDEEVGFGFLYNPITMALKQPTAVAGKKLHGVHLQGSSNGWAVGEGGVIIKTTNGGSAWTAQTAGTTQTLNKVRFFTANDGIIVGNAGTILRTTNGGTTWAATTVGTQNLNAVYYGSATQIWIAGNGGTILYSSNGGTTWSTQTTGMTTDLNGIGGYGTGTVWACGDGGKMLKYSGGATEAVTLPITEPEVAVYPVPAQGSIAVSWAGVDQVTVRLTDVTGREVLHVADVAPGSQMDVSGLSAGSYFAHCSAGDVQVVKHIVIR